MSPPDVFWEGEAGVKKRWAIPVITALACFVCGLAPARAFLEEIRRNHDKLTETRGGCALWAKREWVSLVLAGFSSDGNPSPRSAAESKPIPADVKRRRADV